MMTKRIAFAIGLLLLFSLCSGAAGAEEPVPATPTDLACLHEHTKTTIYFFDSPAYTPVDVESHQVSGPATIETVCLDCGELLSSETVDNAEEIRPHSMKKGACVLCGYRPKAKAPEERPTDAPGEMTIIAQEDDSADGLLTLTLTNTDLYEMETASVSTVLVRGRTGDTAVALVVPDVLGQTEQAGADLYLQLAEREDGSFFAGLYLVSGPGEKTEPEDEGISLRFYRQNLSNVRVSLAPADEDTLIEAEGVWNEKGYWSVPYVEEGTYFLLQ